ncbi:MAG TPA: SDR family NAD(P)-dependent oxidoreductase [Chthoniobacterales bacterium]|nr:SDR family NAD(P)-dependent oxidoreductase [Chthoniobacterales bacterium]
MKRIFITGASSGIGLAITQGLMARGDEVWGTSRQVSNLPSHERFHAVRLDLRSTGELEEVFGRALAEAGHFDVVINNAGTGHFGPAELLTATEIAELFDVLFFSHVRLMQLALADMRRRGQGMVINVTSLATLLPVPFMGAYNAAKSAMAAFTMSLQIELGDGNVRVVDVQPADIRTNFNDAVSRNRDTGYEARVAKTWSAVDTNMKGAPGPELVARAVMRVIDQKNPPMRVIVGDVFQAKIAPFIFRFLPQRTRIWGLKKYYGI